MICERSCLLVVNINVMIHTVYGQNCELFVFELNSCDILQNLMFVNMKFRLVEEEIFKLGDYRDEMYLFLKWLCVLLM